MLYKQTSLILALIIGIQVMSGCSGPSGNANNAGPNTNADTANANRAIEPGLEGAKDNAEELATLIKMPFEPEDLVWKESNTGNAGEKQGRRLLAVFQFTPADAKKLIENGSKIRPGKPVTLSSEKWFPKELVTQNEISGDEGIRATSYAADDFFLPPYSEGTLSHVDNTDFFVLEVFAK